MAKKQKKPQVQTQEKKKKMKPKDLMFKLVIYLIIASFVITGVLSGMAGMGMF